LASSIGTRTDAVAMVKEA